MALAYLCSMAKQDFQALREKLEAQESWPSVYMFKFIVPADNRRIALVEALFGPEAQVSLRESGKGNFVSITGKELMLSADEVIKRYQKAQDIEGLIAL